jgi:hypothetical protein
MSQGLAGIQAVKAPGIENVSSKMIFRSLCSSIMVESIYFCNVKQVDATDIISGHSSYLSNTQDVIKALNIDSYYSLHPSKLGNQ